MEQIVSIALLVFFVLSFFYSVIGYYVSRSVVTVGDYFLAGRKLGIVSVASTLIATQVGGAMLLGTSQWAYKYGLYGFAYSLGASLGFIILALGFAAKLNAGKTATIAELFEIKYGSVSLRRFASFISIISLFGLLIMLVVASRSFLMSLGDVPELLFLIFWLMLVIYTMSGGLGAVVATDKLQLLFIVGVLGGVVGYCMLYTPQGVLSLGELLAQQKMFHLPSMGAMGLVGTWLMPMLFALIEQDLAQCFFAASSERVALWAALGAAVGTVAIGAIPVYFGMQVYCLGLDVPEAMNPFIIFLRYVCNDFMLALALCGLLVAIISTADTVLCAISSNVVWDFPELTREKSWNYTFVSKVVTACVGIAALIISYFVSKDIIYLAVRSYEVSVGCLLVPVVYALYGTKHTKAAAYLSVFFGGVAFLCIQFVTIPLLGVKEIGMLLASLLGYHIGLLW
ncbi:MAG: sodium:solute symporter family protein [Candidatus Babeliales bacterium]